MKKLLFWVKSKSLALIAVLVIVCFTLSSFSTYALLYNEKSFTFNLNIVATSFNVSFDLGYVGGEDIGDVEIQHGDTFSNLPTPNRNGYFFNGWMLNGNLVDGNTTFTGNSDVVLEATWDKGYYINLILVCDVNGVSVTSVYDIDSTIEGQQTAKTVAIGTRMNAVLSGIPDHLIIPTEYMFNKWVMIGSNGTETYLPLSTTVFDVATFGSVEEITIAAKYIHVDDGYSDIF